MNKIEAIKYLVDHDEYRDEWTGAGMWEAVLEVMKSEEPISEDKLKQLLSKARNF